MEVGGQLHALAALTPVRYPLDMRMSGPQSRIESRDEEKKFHHYPFWELNLDQPARKR
jgi:hypothetical protein